MSLTFFARHCLHMSSELVHTVSRWFAAVMINVPMTVFFFIFLFDSTLRSDVKSEKRFLVAIFLHRVLGI